MEDGDAVHVLTGGLTEVRLANEVEGLEAAGSPPLAHQWCHG